MATTVGAHSLAAIAPPAKRTVHLGHVQLAGMQTSPFSQARKCVTRRAVLVQDLADDGRPSHLDLSDRHDSRNSAPRIVYGFPMWHE